MSSAPKIETLVLDAAPLLSLSPLRGLARTYVTIPQVIAELRDQRARQHFEQLGLIEGVNVQVRNPDAAAIATVSAASKKTGDFAVLSRTDLLLLALTYSLHAEEEQTRKALGSSTTPEAVALDASPEFMDAVVEEDVESSESSEDDEEEDEDEDDDAADDGFSAEAPDAETEVEQADTETPLPDVSSLAIVDLNDPQPTRDDNDRSIAPVFEDPVSEDDGEGEWITPDNVAVHKSREVFSSASTSGRQKNIQTGPLAVACMTADYAMQNVILHMGLNLVGLEGKKITNVKSWVLRCHACYKLCKDQTKKFCPSCGNPTLIRASVSTIAAPPGSSAPATVQVHLKKNFQYHNRGTIYSIPTPKPGNAKGSHAKNLILREDQIEFQRGIKNEEVRARKEEKRMNSALKAGDGRPGKSWADPDWMPDMVLGKASGTGRRGSALPDVGYGRRNPNDVRRKKK